MPYFEVKCGDHHVHQVLATSHKTAVKKVLSGTSPNTWAPLARVRQDHERQAKRKWYYIDPLVAYGIKKIEVR